nr:uncharacterized protein LOC122321872 [Drosophila bipectinata]
MSEDILHQRRVSSRNHDIEMNEEIHNRALLLVEDMCYLMCVEDPKSGTIFQNTEPKANSWLKDTQDSCCPKLSRLQRIVGFVACLGMGGLCISLSTLYIPVLILKARKFAFHISPAVGLSFDLASP